jgi:hypothetical protein
MRPTETAKMHFNLAFQFSQSGATVDNVLTILNQLAQGLDAMAVGLRATYIKLEEIEETLKRTRVR